MSRAGGQNAPGGSGRGPMSAAEAARVLTGAQQSAVAGRLGEAEQACRQVLSGAPVHPGALALLGAVLVAGRRWQEAIDVLRCAVSASADTAPVRVNLGAALAEAGQAAEAEQELRTAVNAQPSFAPGWFALGNLLRSQERPEEAADAYRRAVDAAPGHRAALLNLGAVLLQSRRHEEALDAYRRALAISGDAKARATARSNVAFTLEHMHRAEEARAEAEAALRDDPALLNPRITLARLDAASGNAPGAVERLQSAAGMPASDDSRGELFTELGHALDRMGEYGRAFEAFSRANSLYSAARPGHQAKAGAYVAGVRRQAAVLTADLVRAWPTDHGGDTHEPPIFVCGFPRSGTTLIERILGSREGVEISDERPLLFAARSRLNQIVGPAAPYPECLGRIDEAQADECRAAYWAQVERLLGSEATRGRVIDKLPFNLIHLGAIRRLFPRSGVIVVLRDPRDCCLSCFMQSFTPDSAAHFYSLESTARLYSAMMDLWISVRDAQRSLGLRTLEVRYEDLVREPERIARQMLEFAGLPWDDGVLRFFEKARTRAVSTPSFQGVTQPVYDRSVARWRKYRTHLEPVLPTLERYLTPLGYRDDA